MNRLAIRMILRDWRARELHFLLVALIIAVAALSSVGFFVESLQTGLYRNANQLLGADLVLSSDHPLNTVWEIEAHKRALKAATTVEFSSMIVTGEGNNSASSLVAVKAVSDGYPLRGKLTLRQGSGAIITHEIPAMGTAWVDPNLMIKLNLKLGSALRLGDKTLVVNGVIAQEPDAGAAALAYAPRLMVSVYDLPATHLLGLGARARYHLMLAGESTTVGRFEAFLKSAMQTQNLRGIHLDSLQTSQSQIGETIGQTKQFLSVVSLLTALLAAIAVAMAARRFTLRHIDTYAMLRCLGLPSGQVTQMFLVEFLIAGFIGSAFGVLLGYAGHFVLIHFLGKLAADDLAPAGWLPALQGHFAGLLLLLGFAMPPLLQLRHIPHTQLVRREGGLPTRSTWLAYLLGLLMFVGLIVWQTGDLSLGLMMIAAFLIALLLFAGCAAMFLVCLTGLRRLFDYSAWQFALASLLRQRVITITQIVSLALGLMALLVLVLVRNELMSRWDDTTPADAPNHYIINIQPEQVAEVRARLQSMGKPDFFPTFRGRLLSLNGKPFKPSSYDKFRAQDLVEREIDLSSAAELPDGNTITSGKWYRDTSSSAAEVSVDETTVKDLKLALGDTLGFDIAGQPLRARITSVRKINPHSHRIPFPFLLNPQATQHLPSTWVSDVYLPETDSVRRQLDQLTKDYPNLTVFNIGVMMDQVKTMLRQVSNGVEFLFLFTLLAGLAVVYGTFASSQDSRMHQTALMRALGATGRQLSQAQWIEYVLLGALSGLLAASGASATSYALAHFTLHLAWQFSPSLWCAGLAAGAACAIAGGWLGLRQVLKHPPLLILRQV